MAALSISLIKQPADRRPMSRRAFVVRDLALLSLHRHARQTLERIVGDGEDVEDDAERIEKCRVIADCVKWMDFAQEKMNEHR